jgi:predicted adenine nucleotide alpha hydrolase (AANH) superfamily ATPase
MVLHTCCGPCLASCRTVIVNPDLSGTILYYSNSNLLDREEWDRRLQSLEILAGHLGLQLEVDPYDHESWLKAVSGHSDEPEGGSRCSLCFRFNLERTARFAAETGHSPFATTLTVSKYKDSRQVLAEGSKMKGFDPIDFKTTGDPVLGQSLSKELGLYRQKFCGCEYSKKAL